MSEPSRIAKYGMSDGRPDLPAAAAGDPAGDDLRQDVRERDQRAARLDHEPGWPARLLDDDPLRRHRRAAEHHLRDPLRADAGASGLLGQGHHQLADRPALRGLPGGDRAVAVPRLRRRRIHRRPAERRGHPDHLLHPRPGAGHGVRLAALRGARGDARAAGDRRRPGAGGHDARVLSLADVLEDHPAVDPLGRDLRGRAGHRALARRVRSGRGGLGQDLRPDRDPSDLRRERVRHLQRGGRVRRGDPAGDSRRRSSSSQ